MKRVEIIVGQIHVKRIAEDMHGKPFVEVYVGGESLKRLYEDEVLTLYHTIEALRAKYDDVV